jgi:hypothetical protein
VRIVAGFDEVSGIRVKFGESGSVLLSSDFCGLEDKQYAGRRNRTADARIFSPSLYRLSYPGMRKICGKYSKGMLAEVGIGMMEC